MSNKGSEISESQFGSNKVPLAKQHNNGVLAGVLCYILWGLFPLYWKLLGSVNSFEVIAHRIIWCFVFTTIICLIGKFDFIALLKDKRARCYLIPASILITINWSLYIFAVDIDRIIETAIGYYLNPLVSIVLGMIIFKERLSRLQAIATILCVCGLLAFAIGYSSFPWISIGLALSFGVYGAVKKKGGYPAIEAIAVENTVMVVPAILAAILLAYFTGQHAFMTNLDEAEGVRATLLLIGGGLVTAIPLILFARAANTIPLTILGFIQYLSPTIALVLGVFVNGEPFTVAHAVCLGFIWTGILLVVIDSLVRTKKLKAHQRGK